MKNFLKLLILCLGLTINAQSKTELNYYLPTSNQYNKSIPTPESILGFQIGERHPSYDQVVNYLSVLAKSSNRIVIENRGLTHENRPLLLLTITSEKNHQNIDKIKAEHLKLSDNLLSKNLNINQMPLVVQQGFSVHGNEASGSNAALLLAYHLVAAEGEQIEKLLSNTIILIEPTLNPDGFHRFSSWINMHKSQVLNPDPNDREFNEVWPGGRTNHYWIDLNRDWLAVQQPESKVRIKSFHQWYPNILTDFHEMGSNATYFFQPGKPSSINPLTPVLNQQFTKEISKYFAKDLDQFGSLYFTEENFDDYFYGKGSTYPDINGSIGILFEQASSRGSGQITENGLLTFSYTIKNQLISALATLDAGLNLRTDLLNYQRNFFIDIDQKAAKDKTKALVFSDDKDATKTLKMAQILNQHQINLHQLKEDINIKGKQFKKENSYVIPLQQKNYAIIQTLFEKRTQFTDSLFYDVSTWTLPLAFNISYDSIANKNFIGDKITDFNPKPVKSFEKSSIAYLFEWHDYQTPAVLNKILAKGIRVKTSLKQFVQNGKLFDYGSILIPVQNQVMNADEIYQFLINISKDYAIEFNSTNSSLTDGIDLGSPNFASIKTPKIAMIIGDGVSGYDAGEIWHLFDIRYQMNLTKIDINRLNRVDLSDYTTLILPNFNGKMDASLVDKIKEFVQNGGILVGYQNSVKWMTDQKMINLTFKTSKPETKNVSFENRNNLRGAQETGGAIFEVQLDRSHPINFGISTEKMPFFRDTNIFIEPDSTSIKNPIQYTKNPLMSGYISKENLKIIGQTLPFKMANLGRGKVIAFTDNTSFRTFWLGTDKLLMNVVFFGSLM